MWGRDKVNVKYIHVVAKVDLWQGKSEVQSASEGRLGRKQVIYLVATMGAMQKEGEVWSDKGLFDVERKRNKEWQKWERGRK